MARVSQIIQAERRKARNKIKGYKQKINLETDKKYRENNKERIREYHKEMREISKEIGNCVCCYKIKYESNYLTCKKCRESITRSIAKRKAKQKSI